MSQICPDCSVETGDAEVWCPKCGARLGVHEPGIKEKLAKWGFILFNVAMGGIFISTMHGTANSTPDHVTAALSATMVIGFWGAGALLLGVLMLALRPKN